MDTDDELVDIVTRRDIKIHVQIFSKVMVDIFVEMKSVGNCDVRIILDRIFFLSCI